MTHRRRSADPLPASVDHEVVVRLRSAIMRMSRDLRRMTTDEGLTTTQSTVLATVVRRGELPAGELAGIEGLNPTMLSRVLNHLEEAGLLARTKDPEDRRNTLVSPTSKGQRLVQRVRDRRSVELQDRLQQLDPDAIDDVLRALPSLEKLARIDHALDDGEPSDRATTRLAGIR